MLFRFSSILLLCAAVMLSAGCKKQPDSTQAPPAKPVTPVAETIASVHWIGKKQMAADTNAAYLLEIWGMPESARLEAQTLDKLAGAAAQRLGSVQESETNSSGTLLRPLLEDFIREEWTLGIQNVTNSPGETVLAIKVDDERAAAWEAGIAAARKPGTVSGKRSNIEIGRVGGWTLVGFSLSTNHLFRDTSEQIRRSGKPLSASGSNVWLEAEVDFSRIPLGKLGDFFGAANTPKMTLAVSGHGQNVRTRGLLKFPKPLDFQFEPWSIPTNLIHDPIESFTAVQGVRLLLSSSRFLGNPATAAPPNQVFFWSQVLPFLTFCAAPVADPSNIVVQTLEHLSQTANPRLATNHAGKIVKSEEVVDGVAWAGVPLIQPTLRALTNDQGSFIWAGAVPRGFEKRQMPPELVQEVLTQTNLVYYDWEITQPRIEGWLQLGQLLRLILNKAQLPPDSAASLWLRAVALRLGNCVTVLTRTAPDELALARDSSVGLTGIELHLLADWLESPAFPQGLHTMLAPYEVPGRRAATNNVPQ